VLAGVLLKLGGYGLIRAMPMVKISPIAPPVATWVLLGGVLLRAICLRHSDIKVLIAYSSVVHMTLVILGSLRGPLLGAEGALVTMIAHGICSSGLFAWANIMYERTHSRRLMLNKGVLAIRPQTSV